jgi:excisionase family DNA binding protein
VQQAAKEPALSTKETMTRLHMSRETVRKLIGAGELDAYKIGPGRTSDLRITEQSIRDYIERHRVVPRTSP